MKEADIVKAIMKYLKTVPRSFVIVVRSVVV